MGIELQLYPPRPGLDTLPDDAGVLLPEEDGVLLLGAGVYVLVLLFEEELVLELLFEFGVNTSLNILPTLLPPLLLLLYCLVGATAVVVLPVLGLVVTTVL